MKIAKFAITVLVESLIVCAMTFSGGCHGLARPVDVRDLDAPVLIMKGRGSVRVAAFNEQTQRLEVLPDPIRISEFEGFTMTRFDWSKTTYELPTEDDLRR